MPNERLRDALLRNGLTPEQVAKAIGVDPKTVERWITKGRTPYQKHRHAISAMAHETESYLWPDAVQPERAAEISGSEVLKIYPHRHAVPRDLWSHLLDGAAREIEILVYVGMFLTEDRSILRKLTDKAEAGARIRLLFGDPASSAISRRSTEENIGKNTITAKIRQALAFFQPVADVDGVDIRVHGTTLYNSIYRYDDEMIVNPHVYGFQAPHAPALHLRRLSAGDLFETYSESFEAVWKASKPAKW
jgi:transcriptional regulator with XRE-family HTH domain